MTEPAPGFTEDTFLGGQLRLRQPKSGHRAGHDAMLLAAATPARAGARVVDFGAGAGAAGLAVARRVAGIELILIEIDEMLADLARSNAAANEIAAKVLAFDVTAAPGVFAAAGLLPDSVDVVLMNPPFNNPARHRASPDKARVLAHVASPSMLEQWLHAARRILKSDGFLSLIWRADDLPQLLAALDRGFGSLAILPVHGDEKMPAIRVLVRATKGGKSPTAIYAGLVLNGGALIAGQQVQEILDGKAVLPLARR